MYSHLTETIQAMLIEYPTCEDGWGMKLLTSKGEIMHLDSKIVRLKDVRYGATFRLVSYPAAPLETAKNSDKKGITMYKMMKKLRPSYASYSLQFQINPNTTRPKHEFVLDLKTSTLEQILKESRVIVYKTKH